LLTSAAVFVLPRVRFKRYLKLAGLLAGVTILIVLSQRFYYIREIPGWKNEEAIRQSLFTTFNRPNKSSIAQADSTAVINVSLIRALFLYDTSFTNPHYLNQYSQSVGRMRD
jgi:hypothetical protein